MATYAPIPAGQDYLTKLAANENQVRLGITACLVMALACGGIAVALYPVLKKYSRRLALGAA